MFNIVIIILVIDKLFNFEIVNVVNCFNVPKSYLSMYWIWEWMLNNIVSDKNYTQCSVS